MKQAKGFTIIQTMIVLLIAGIVAWFVINAIIDKRCEAEPSNALCADRAPASK
jgi:Tfp pilus assembly protein PilE